MIFIKSNYLHKFHSKEFFVFHLHKKTTEDQFMQDLTGSCSSSGNRGEGITRTDKLLQVLEIVEVVCFYYHANNFKEVVIFNIMKNTILILNLI